MSKPLQGDGPFYYLVFGKSFGANLDYEVFATADEARERAREVDKIMATEWVVIKGHYVGMGIDDSIDWFENE